MQIRTIRARPFEHCMCIFQHTHARALVHSIGMPEGRENNAAANVSTTSVTPRGLRVSGGPFQTHARMSIKVCVPSGRINRHWGVVAVLYAMVSSGLLQNVIISYAVEIVHSEIAHIHYWPLHHTLSKTRKHAEYAVKGAKRIGR